MYIAHINEKTGKVQSVKEHNENVAELCRQFSIPQLQEICSATGKLHDIGKYGRNFQRRINGENIHVDHSTAGAAVMQEHYGTGVRHLCSPKRSSLTLQPIGKWAFL